MVKKVFLKGSIFIIILLIIMSTLNSIFVLKTEHREKLTEGLYANTGDSYDVVILGSSHMNSGLNPNLLWNQYGITSFDFATSGQSIDVTYYLLKEVLKKHKNSIVVVDLYYLGLLDKYNDDGYVRSALDNLRFSPNKVNAIVNCTPPKQWINFLFPIFKYHNRFKELTETDFNFDPTVSYYAKGFDAGVLLYGKDNTSSPAKTGMANIPPKPEEYLNKIMALSKKEGFKLIFTNTPYDYNNASESTTWVKDAGKMFNKVAEISKNNNIPFINYCDKLDEMGFDFKTDMYNSGHLNMNGSTKMTLNFGKFLKENYELVDNRNNPKYENWNTYYIYYSQVKADAALARETDIKKYANLMKNENYSVVINSNGSGVPENSILRDALSQLGLKFNEQKGFDSNYLAFISGNKIESETSSSSKLSKEFVVDKDTNLSATTKSEDKNMPSFFLNGNEYLNKHNGLNIVVYDKVMKKVIDSIYVDSNNVVKR